MTAKINFPAGSEPTQAQVIILLSDKGGFRKTIFLSNPLHHIVRQIMIQNADGCGIPAKNLIGKGIHNKLTDNAHSSSSC